MYRITNDPIDLNALYSAVSDPGCGAAVLFLGTVRNQNIGRDVQYLEYQAYPEMAEWKMAEIGEVAQEKWPIKKIAIIHRVGKLSIGEISIAIAVSTPHRSEAFQACRFIIDRVKAVVPVWKKEYFVGGEVWLENEEGFHPIEPI